MADHSEINPLSPSPRRDEETLKLLMYFYNKCCVAEKLTREQAIALLPEYLLAWISTNLFQFDKSEVIEESQSSEIGWDFLMEILDNVAGPLMIQPLWTIITLAYRGVPKYPIIRISNSLIFFWEDGYVMPVTQTMYTELVTGGLRDSFVGCEIHRINKQNMLMLMNESVDVLHDKYGGQMGGEHPFEILMSAIIKIIPQLKEEYREPVSRYARMIQQIFYPSIPPEIKAKIDKAREERLAL
jgi:hypothetical protein